MPVSDPWPAASAASGEEDDSVIGQELRAAAREATAHVRQYQRDAIDQATLDEFHAEVARLSRMTSPGEQIVAFADMREIRDEIRRLLDRRLWPRQVGELYLLLGLLHKRMATTAYQLGVPAAAAKLIRTGLAYADAIDDELLETRLRANLSAIVN